MVTVLRSARPDINFAVPSDHKVVYLTIDDGPSERTPEILAVLQRHRAPATFFVTGSHVRDPELLRRIVSGGHALGNHLWTTATTSALSLAEFQRDLDATQAVLVPHHPVRLFRPSADFGTREQIRHASERGLRPVMGTAYPFDHRLQRAKVLIRLAYWLRTPGGIVILHDGNVRGATTARVLDELIPKLRAAGYEIRQLESDLLVGPP